MELKLENEIVSYLFVTESAASKIKELIEEESQTAEKPIGIRLYLKPKGCSGMKYSIEFANPQNISKHDDLLIAGDIKIFIDPKISMWVVGTEMHYEDDKISSGFIFKNPNEKGRCGCGESFYV